MIATDPSRRGKLNAGNRLSDVRELRNFLRSLWTPDLRLALLFCIPGIMVAIALRLWLMYHMPFGFVHGDTAQQLATPLTLLQDGRFDINHKKTFLTPVLYSVSAVAHIPVLYFAAAFQHLAGVLLVVVTGLLAKAWFSSWRLWILPLTVLIAINPTLLWYEHTALPESLTVFGAATVALAGTFFFRRPNRYTLTILFLAALFVASARPEGHFFALFALALVVRRFWSDWSQLKIYTAVSSTCVFLIFLLTQTGESGRLLYGSLIQWSPAHLTVEPGLAEAMQPHQAEAIRQWERYRRRYVRFNRDMYNSGIEWLMAQGIPNKTARSQVNGVFKRAGIEIAVRNFWRLPGLAIQKFFMGHNEPPAPGFFDYAIQGQLRSLYLVNGGWNALEFSRLLWGMPLATMDEARPFLEARYDTSAGQTLTDFADAFVTAELYPLIFMKIPGSRLQGLPWLYVCALIGAVCLIVRDRPAIGVQLIWFSFLCALFVVLMVTANDRARYRIIFEPFWFIYLFGLLDSLVAFASKVTSSITKEEVD
jgi:hypothetical protein